MNQVDMHDEKHGKGHQHGHPVEIIVNGRPRLVHEKRLSYIEVVQLAYPGEVPTETIVFTVTYSHPHGRDGTLAPGEEVAVKRGMIFNVRKTDRS